MVNTGDWLLGMDTIQGPLCILSMNAKQGGDIMLSILSNQRMLLHSLKNAKHSLNDARAQQSTSCVHSEAGQPLSMGLRK